MEILLPKMGESVAEATIIRWVVEEGQSVAADEPIIEIATDKVDSEVPAPEDGVLVKHLVAEGDVVQVGQPIAVFSMNGEETTAVAAETPPAQESAPATIEEESPAVPSEAVLAEVSAPLAPTPAPVSSPSQPGSLPSRESGGRFYSPLVRSIAAKEGIGQAELDAIPGSGKGGRVTKKDMMAHLADRGQSAVGASAPAPVAPRPAPSPAPQPVAVSMDGEDEIVEMDRMRKLIADHMVRSVQTSPHVTSFVEADVTRIVDWRKSSTHFF